MHTLEKYYDVTLDKEGKEFVNIELDWDYAAAGDLSRICSREKNSDNYINKSVEEIKHIINDNMVENHTYGNDSSKLSNVDSAFFELTKCARQHHKMIESLNAIVAT